MTHYPPAHLWKAAPPWFVLPAPVAPFPSFFCSGDVGSSLYSDTPTVNRVTSSDRAKGTQPNDSQRHLVLNAMQIVPMYRPLPRSQREGPYAYYSTTTPTTYFSYLYPYAYGYYAPLAASGGSSSPANVASRWPPQQQKQQQQQQQRTQQQSVEQTTTTTTTTSAGSGLNPGAGNWPAPRRGRGLLSTQAANVGRIPICASCNVPIRYRKTCA